ncbi:hypothetical protein WJ0W_001189 [Paenibacillus melissococcoides]|uniref:Uncharacterized protein n=1 Tax=Paenibacillus melissococcoides TaxID=2912268 RepID=A0ABN8U327_9BACL|nr:hypothetical protein WJ0W_001189 [Paenibacillus melissococcoides]
MACKISNLIFGLYFDGKLGFTPKQISLIITFGALIGVIVQAVLIDRFLRRAFHCRHLI